MGAVFMVGFFFRAMIYYTVRRHEWFAKEFEKRVNRFIEGEVPGKAQNVSFYVLSKKLLERTYYEVFEIRDRMKRRKPDSIMATSDRVFLVRQGCAWLVKDILKQLKFLKWSEGNPKLLNITKATLQHNPCFNRVFGVIPMVGLNDLISILPGLFVVGGILGTFIGIAGGLQELGTMNLQDLESTKNIMDRFLHEISFAMKTSIVGIIFSLLSHVTNVILSPERSYVSMVDRFESALDLLWYRSDNNNYPEHERPFDEHRDAVEALAEDALNKEIGKAAIARGA
ncbi:hypothetical protein AZI87_15820 [Bdellovibrio bacteriovorus]|uniref:MotA/TolQ/ExbB proton channel domain-containing protein n=2 Tax=Pseudobdellovibrionaceae TaxID=213483 RepID=A0A161PPA1_BDEBC|nr:hypothetical protein AZI87_15820 [Bdellovibrio bacteriovorus]